MMAAGAEVQQAATPAGDSEAAGIRTGALLKALARLGIQDWAVSGCRGRTGPADAGKRGRAR